MEISQPFYTFGIPFSFPGSDFLGTKKRGEQTAGMVREAVISNWLAVFGAPEILIVDKDKKIHRGDIPRLLYRPQYSATNGYSRTSSKTW